MIERPVIPTVLVVVNKDSQLEILQDRGVIVAYSDERVDIHSVTLLPQIGQAIELNDRLDGKIVVSLSEDHGETALHAIRRLRNLSTITTGIKADKEAS